MGRGDNPLPISKALCLFRSFFFSALAHQYDSNANQSNQNHGNGWAHNGKQTGGDDALAFILKRCLNDFVVAGNNADISTGGVCVTGN